MATVSVLNTDANLSGNTLATNEVAGTITAAWTFDRDPSAPFVVTSGSAVVSNLDADKLDGVEGASFLRSDTADTVTAGGITFNDSINANFGTAGSSDSSITYNGTNLVIDVASGNLSITTGDVAAAGTGPHAFGTAVDTQYQFQIGGALTLTSGDTSASLRVAGAVTIAADSIGAGIVVDPAITEAGSGTHASLSGIYVSPSFTGAAGATTTASGIEVQTFAAPSSTNAVGVYIAAVPTGGTNNFGFWNATTSRLDGNVFIGDTSNANATLGLTINQGAADNQALCLKSSDVATGLTTLPSVIDVETDDYFVLGKTAGATGGMLQLSLAESTTTVSHYFEAWGGSPVTTDTTGSTACVSYYVGEHDGANSAVDMAADSNAFLWGEITSGFSKLARMILKADDGELHLGNTTLVALDGEDDVSLVRAMQWETSKGDGMAPTPWDTEDYGVPPFSYEKLRAVGVLGEKDAEGNCLMRVQPRFAMNEGAIWQLHCRLEEQRRQIESLTATIQRLES